jgi:hypothetical protein
MKLDLGPQDMDALFFSLQLMQTAAKNAMMNIQDQVQKEMENVKQQSATGSGTSGVGNGTGSSPESPRAPVPYTGS